MKKKKKKIKDLLLHWPSQKEKKDHSELQINICQLKKPSRSIILNRIYTF